jgi:hypothetical protein
LAPQPLDLRERSGGIGYGRRTTRRGLTRPAQPFEADTDAQDMPIRISNVNLAHVPRLVARTGNDIGSTMPYFGAVCIDAINEVKYTQESPISPRPARSDLYSTH